LNYLKKEKRELKGHKDHKKETKVVNVFRKRKNVKRP